MVADRRALFSLPSNQPEKEDRPSKTSFYYDHPRRYSQLDRDKLASVDTLDNLDADGREIQKRQEARFAQIKMRHAQLEATADRIVQELNSQAESQSTCSSSISLPPEWSTSIGARPTGEDLVQELNSQICRLREENKQLLHQNLLCSAAKQSTLSDLRKIEDEFESLLVMVRPVFALLGKAAASKPLLAVGKVAEQDGNVMCIEASACSPSPQKCPIVSPVQSDHGPGNNGCYESVATVLDRKALVELHELQRQQQRKQRHMSGFSKSDMQLELEELRKLFDDSEQQNAQLKLQLAEMNSNASGESDNEPPMHQAVRNHKHQRQIQQKKERTQQQQAKQKKEVQYRPKETQQKKETQQTKVQTQRHQQKVQAEQKKEDQRQSREAQQEKERPRQQHQQKIQAEQQIEAQQQPKEAKQKKERQKQQQQRQAEQKKENQQHPKEAKQGEEAEEAKQPLQPQKHLQQPTSNKQKTEEFGHHQKQQQLQSKQQQPVIQPKSMSKAQGAQQSKQRRKHAKQVYTKQTRRQSRSPKASPEKPQVPKELVGKSMFCSVCSFDVDRNRFIHKAMSSNCNHRNHTWHLICN